MGSCRQGLQPYLHVNPRKWVAAMVHGLRSERLRPGLAPQFCPLYRLFKPAQMVEVRPWCFATFRESWATSGPSRLARPRQVLPTQEKEVMLVKRGFRLTVTWSRGSVSITLEPN